MKVGISGFAWKTHFDVSLLSVLPRLREHGLEVFEIGMFDPSALDATLIRRGMEENGLQCTVCAILPGNINPISSDSSERATALAHLSRCLETASEMGAILVGGPILAPIGFLPPRRHTTDETQRAVEYLSQLTPLLDSLEMELCIEPVNRSESMFVRTVKQAVDLCMAVNHPRVGITIDTFHANIEEKSVPGSVLEAGRYLRHIHASENDRGPLGSGHIDFAGLMSALKQINYDGTVMIEGFGYSVDEGSALGGLLANPADSPEDIAFGGAAYLRELWASVP